MLRTTRIFSLNIILLTSSLFLEGVLCGPLDGVIQGQVTLKTTGEPLHRANVVLVQLGLIVETDTTGHYIFNEIPPGVYDLRAHLEALSFSGQVIEISSGQTQTIDIRLGISPLRHEVTVKAKELRSTVHLDAFEIAENPSSSIGEVLDGQPGLAKRTFGSGNARPVIRGFDGDRVLILQDGLRTGSLGSTSADHAEPIHVSNIERLEVLKGPATLLYGSNAVGGVVNAITVGQDYRQKPSQGATGQVSSSIGSNGLQAGISTSVDFGHRNWLFWSGGGSQKSGDYRSPLGVVKNSGNRLESARVGLGWIGDRWFGRVGYDLSNGRYGLPISHHEDHHEEVNHLTAFKWHKLQFSGGLKNIGSFIDTFHLTSSYNDYGMQELNVEETEKVEIDFQNKVFVYRGVFEQRPLGNLSGSFGFWGANRNFDVVGTSNNTPSTDQDSLAFFCLEELTFERVIIQFGARIEHIRYQPRAGINRQFTGFSGALGVKYRFSDSLDLTGNYTNSHRAPALEELYNYGIHLGAMVFELGTSNLKSETNHGFDFSLRQSNEKMRGQVNIFYYPIHDFVFLAPTGNLRMGLIEAAYTQADVRFLGAELDIKRELKDHVWLNLGLDWVDAKLTSSGVPLPRIPPLRARFGLAFHYGGLSLRPEIILTGDQDRIFHYETRTSGYTVANLKASYTLQRQHFAHHFSVKAQNVGDRLYRNHVSIIKDLIPEKGRGISFSYLMKFF